MSQTEAGSSNVPSGESPPNAPLWAKAFGVIVVILFLLAGVAHFTGHSPMGHMPHARQQVHQP